MNSTKGGWLQSMKVAYANNCSDIKGKWGADNLSKTEVKALHASVSDEPESAPVGKIILDSGNVRKTPAMFEEMSTNNNGVDEIVQKSVGMLPDIQSMPSDTASVVSATGIVSDARSTNSRSPRRQNGTVKK